MNNNNLVQAIYIISKVTGIKKDNLEINSRSADFPRWDSIAQIKIIIELEKKKQKKINTSIMSELNSVSKIAKFLDS